MNVPKRTFTPFGLLRLQNPQQRPPNGASSNEQPSEPARIVDVERQKYLTPNIHTARDRLRVAVPATATLFDRLAVRGEALRPHTVRLLALLDDYGPQELAAATATALARDALGAGSIAHLLEIRRRQQGRTPPLPLALPNRPGVRDLDVRPHRLESYDALTSRPDDLDE